METIDLEHMHQVTGGRTQPRQQKSAEPRLMPGPNLARGMFGDVGFAPPPTQYGGLRGEFQRVVDSDRRALQQEANAR